MSKSKKFHIKKKTAKDKINNETKQNRQVSTKLSKVCSVNCFSAKNPAERAPIWKIKCETPENLKQL